MTMNFYGDRVHVRLHPSVRTRMWSSGHDVRLPKERNTRLGELLFFIHIVHMFSSCCSWCIVSTMKISISTAREYTSGWCDEPNNTIYLQFFAIKCSSVRMFKVWTSRLWSTCATGEWLYSRVIVRHRTWKNGCLMMESNQSRTWRIKTVNVIETTIDSLQ